jgi:hypothetical protein
LAAWGAEFSSNDGLLLTVGGSLDGFDWHAISETLSQTLTPLELDFFPADVDTSP